MFFHLFVFWVIFWEGIWDSGKGKSPQEIAGIITAVQLAPKHSHPYNKHCFLIRKKLINCSMCIAT